MMLLESMVGSRNELQNEETHLNFMGYFNYRFVVEIKALCSGFYEAEVLIVNFIIIKSSSKFKEYD
jgi:hypothetical protein